MNERKTNFVEEDILNNAIDELIGDIFKAKLDYNDVQALNAFIWEDLRNEETRP